MGFKTWKPQEISNARPEANLDRVADNPRDPLAFDPETRPWIDRPDADIDAYLAEQIELSEIERERLGTQLFH